MYKGLLWLRHKHIYQEVSDEGVWPLSRLELYFLTLGNSGILTEYIIGG